MVSATPAVSSPASDGGATSSSALPRSPAEFDKVKVVGNGAKSVVWLVRHRETGAHYALKEIPLERVCSAQEAAHVWNERRCLEALARTNFLRANRLETTMKDDKAVYLVLEFIPGAPLHHHFRQARGFDIERARFYTAELVEALAALHAEGLIYRDLKASNVMLCKTSGRIRLVDFGFAKSLLRKDGDGEAASGGLRRTSSVCGTYFAMAPEVRAQDPELGEANEGYTQSVDWWSLGILVYEMVMLSPPFGYRDGERGDLLDLSKRSPASIDWSAAEGRLGAAGRSFVSELLEADPTRRLGAGGADEVRAHAFFEGFEWERAAVGLAHERAGAPEFDAALGHAATHDFADSSGSGCTGVSIEDGDPFSEF